MRFIEEHNLEFKSIFENLILLENNVLDVKVAVLNNFVNRILSSEYNHFITVVLFASTFVHWIMTGRARAQEQYIANFDYSDRNRNSVHFNLELNENESNDLIQKVNSLFNFNEVQRNKSNAQPINFKYLIAIEEQKHHAYLICIQWYHRDTSDDLILNARKYYYDSKIDENIALVQKFSRLGFN